MKTNFHYLIVALVCLGCNDASQSKNALRNAETALPGSPDTWTAGPLDSSVHKVKVSDGTCLEVYGTEFTKNDATDVVIKLISRESFSKSNINVSDVVELHGLDPENYESLLKGYWLDKIDIKSLP